MLALAALLLAVPVALAAALGGETESGKTPVRDLADPAPQVVVKLPRLVRRRALRQVSKPPVHRKEGDRFVGRRNQP